MSRSSIIIQGILFDEKSSYQQGPAGAPPAIREALTCGSMNRYAENGETVESPAVVDSGDFTIKEYGEIEEITDTHLAEGAKVLTLGGDHSITYPLIKAVSKKHEKFDILHIDAHSDLYSDYEGDPFSHACPFARIMEAGLTSRLVQVGIRTNNAHLNEQTTKFGVEVHEMRDLSRIENIIFDNPVYISLDMDAFDPAYAPGVSHHEPGGLSSRQVIDLIARINVPIVGADIVEYNPTKDFQKMTAFLAAKMMKEILSKMM